MSADNTVVRFLPTKCNKTWSDFFHGRSYTGYGILPATDHSEFYTGLGAGILVQFDDSTRYYFKPSGRALGTDALIEIAEKLKELNDAANTHIREPETT